MKTKTEMRADLKRESSMGDGLFLAGKFLGTLAGGCAIGCGTTGPSRSFTMPYSLDGQKPLVVPAPGVTSILPYGEAAIKIDSIIHNDAFLEPTSPGVMLSTYPFSWNDISTDGRVYVVFGNKANSSSDLSEFMEVDFVNWVSADGDDWSFDGFRIPVSQGGTTVIEYRVRDKNKKWRGPFVVTYSSLAP